MTVMKTSQLALLYPGDRATRDRSDPAASRFSALFDALAAAKLAAEPAVYHDDFAAARSRSCRRSCRAGSPADRAC